MKRTYFSFFSRTAAALSCLLLFASSNAVADDFRSFFRVSPVGGWYGRAVADDPEHAPFPAVWMMPTMFEDGNVIANDSHELNNPHTTAHGNWTYTGPHTIHAVFFFINMGLTPEGLAGNFRVVFDGKLDPRDPDHMFVKLHPIACAPFVDIVSPSTTGATAGCVDGGLFTAAALTRIRASKY